MHRQPGLPMYSLLYLISASQMLTCGGRHNETLQQD